MDCPKRSAVAGLPEDSLVEILARVPASSVYRSKCVSKAWRDLIEDPLYRKKLPQTLQGFFFIDKEMYGRQIGFAGLPARSLSLQIDPSLSFVTELPGIETLTFADSCNGLLLFEHKQKSWPFGLLGYVVCNPATEQCGLVPRCGPPTPVYVREPTRYNYLVFDPSISSHFHLVQFGWEFRHLVNFEQEGFVVEDDEDGDEDNDDEEEDGYVHDYWGRHHQQRYGNDDDDDDDDEEEEEEEEEKEEEEEVSRTSVHVYSSETGKRIHIQSDWSHIESDWDGHDLEGWRHQGLVPRKSSWCAVLSGMLHFPIKGQNQIAAVDVQGVTRKIIPVPTMDERKSWLEPGYITKSQGHLHYINQTSDGELFIWVLEDYDAQAWVLKQCVSFMELFGKKSHKGRKNDYSVVAMHPDGNVVFIVQDWDLKLI